MKSGMLAAESAFEALLKSNTDEHHVEEVDENSDLSVGDHILLTSYPSLMRSSWIYDELYLARNIRPAFAQFGFLLGMIYSAIDAFVFGGKAPYTLQLHKHHQEGDHKALLHKSKVQKIVYEKPDNEITFDILTSLYRSGTNHEHDQPIHLKLRDANKVDHVNLQMFDGPESRYCPARVYEYVDDETSSNEIGKKKLMINAQNCLHCKACDIKDPSQNIQWTVPEGGGGPKYTLM